MTDLGWLNTAALVAVFAAAEYARQTPPPSTIDRQTRRVVARWAHRPHHPEGTPVNMTAEQTTDFWGQIAQQITDLREARTAADVVRICRPIDADVAAYVQPGHGFFQGSGGDYDIREPLREAGWTTAWSRARYYWAMRSPDGQTGITYIEGDVYPTIKVPS